MQFLFRYGELFGLFSGGLAAFCFLLSFPCTKLKKWRPASLTLTLTLILGAGLITNTLLKGYWGRPRPKQIIEFGGHHTYRPFWRPNFERDREPQKSFPSGHVAMGFYYLSLCLVGKRYKNPFLFRVGLCLTVGLGGSLMITRVAQGGHFVSDVLASALLMWLVALLMDRVVSISRNNITTSEGWEKRVFFLKQSSISQESGEASNDL